MKRRAAVTSAGALMLVTIVVFACDRWRFGKEPPFEKFEPAEYRPPVHAPVIAAPQGVRNAWRVEMLQTNPRPFKNPTWTKIPIEAAGLIEMPAGSSFRCLYNPVKVRATSDESLKEVATWHAVREVWCSNDDFRTHSAAALLVTYDRAGVAVRATNSEARLELFDVIDGRPTWISILLRAD